MSVSTRQTLLARLKNLADQDGWQDFFDQYWQLIYGVAIKSGLTRAEAEDVVQETCIAVARKIPDFEYIAGKDSFRGWLMQISRWKIADQFRKRLPVVQRSGTRTAGTRTTDRISDPTGNLEAIWEAEWRRHIVAGALRRVKSRVKGKQFQIYYLHVVKDWPVEKVARRLEVNAGQIYLAKHRISSLVKREVNRLQKGLC